MSLKVPEMSLVVVEESSVESLSLEIAVKQCGFVLVTGGSVCT